MGKIPCVYIGAVPLRLSADHGPYLDGDGARLESRDVSTGQTLMMSEEEVNGMTIWFDPHGILFPERIGPGRCVKEEHAGLSPEELEVAGYQFHEGRSDFVTVAEAARAEAAKKAEAMKAEAAKKAATSGAPAATTKSDAKEAQ